MVATPPLLIKNGTVVNADLQVKADVLVVDGVIREVGNNLTLPEGGRVIDASKKLVIPGGIDPHTHFDFPFMGTTSVDDFYTGTRAALAGGTTTVINFAIEAGTSLMEAYDRYRVKGDAKACCDFGLHVGVTSWGPEEEADMEVLVKKKGVNSFKMFMAYKDLLMLRDDQMLEVMTVCRRLGALAQVHAENGDAIAQAQKEVLEAGVTGPEGHLYSRPEILEAEATMRAATLAHQARCPLYVVHVMSPSAARMIAQARARGTVVFGEVLAAGLGASGTEVFHRCWSHAAGHVLSPPLRTEPDVPHHLMDLLANNELQTTATDHCTFSKAQKAQGRNDFTKIPNGINGVEERMSVVWEKGVVTGKLDPCGFVAATSTNAAKIFNLYPRKGRIQAGSDADIVVWDPEASRTFSTSTHHAAVDFNIFEGLTCRGIPSVVISRGRVVLEDGKLSVSRGWGRFVERPPYAPTVYDRLLVREMIPRYQKIERSE